MEAWRECGLIRAVRECTVYGEIPIDTTARGLITCMANGVA